MITNIKLDLYFYNDIPFCKLSIKSMHPCKSGWSETNINTPTKLSRKRAITQPKFGGWLQYQTWPIFYVDIMLCKVWMKSKVIEQKRTTKTKSEKGHNSAKIWRMITNIELDLYFSGIKFCKIWIKSIHLFKSYWTETKSVTTTPTPPPPTTTPTTRTDMMILMCLPCNAGDTKTSNFVRVFCVVVQLGIAQPGA